MSPSFPTGSILAVGCHVIFVSHAARSLDPLLYVSQFYPSYPTGITFVYVARREPSCPTGYSLLISSQATPAGADLRWGSVVVKYMLIILINGSYVNNYVAPFSVHAAWALSGAPAELFVALLQRLLHVVWAPFCVVKHAIWSLLAEIPWGGKPSIVLPHLPLGSAEVALPRRTQVKTFRAAIFDRLRGAEAPLEVKADLVERRVSCLLGKLCVPRFEFFTLPLIFRHFLAPFAPALAAVNRAPEDVGSVAKEAPLQITWGV